MNLINVLIDNDVISGKDLISIKKKSSEANSSQIEAVFDLKLTDEKKILEILVKEQNLEIVDLKKLRIKIGTYVVAENGKISDSYDEEKLKEYMKWDSIEIEVNLKLGNDAFKCFTCDFTHDYIEINSDYRN